MITCVGGWRWGFGIAIGGNLGVGGYYHANSRPTVRQWQYDCHIVGLARLPSLKCWHDNGVEDLTDNDSWSDSRKLGVIHPLMMSYRVKDTIRELFLQEESVSMVVDSSLTSETSYRINRNKGKSDLACALKTHLFHSTYVGIVQKPSRRPTSTILPTYKNIQTMAQSCCPYGCKLWPPC